MKKVLKILGIILGILIVIILIGASFIYFRGIPTYDVEAPELTVEVTPDRIERGEHLVSLVCANCHASKNGSLEGRYMHDLPTEFGETYVANITRHPESALAPYSDGELYYLLRTGIKRNGEYTPPWMAKFPHMSDEDMYSIIAFLKTEHRFTRPSDRQYPPPKPSFLTKLLCHVAFTPLPMPEEEIKVPLVSDSIAYGEYVANGIVDCYQCHSADFKTMNIMAPEESEGFYGGGNKLLEEDGTPVYSANITPHKEYGIGNWTKEDFMKAVRTGVGKDGEILSPVMPRVTNLTDEELSCIYQYLMTIPPLEKEIDTHEGEI